MSKSTTKQTTKTQTQEQKQKLFADTNISMKSGRLTRDAEILSDGKFAKVSIASNEQYLDAQKQVQTRTSYFNALVSNNLTDAFEIAQNLKKGDWVYLRGKDSTQNFDSAEGYRKSETTMFAYKVVLKKANNADQTDNSPQPQVA